ncbi:hypothetical protein [Streptomyces sp. NPDC005780]|uniref:hypothetical protein n=1 Tax=Streptomyces sp. NPDC005780 TaxID=3364730 RepID=UPI00368B3C5C
MTQPETFGHEPTPNQHHGPVCARCHTTVTHYDEAYQPHRYIRPVPWPCATATVLAATPAP